MSEAYFRRIEAKYQLTKVEFLQLLVEQGSRCASCKRPLVLFSSIRAERPVVDHDHIAEKLGFMVVRGLLCTRCNTAAGYIEKDLKCTVQVLTYIARWSKPGRLDQLSAPLDRYKARAKRVKGSPYASILDQLDALDRLADKVLDPVDPACNTEDAGSEPTGLRSDPSQIRRRATAKPKP